VIVRPHNGSLLLIPQPDHSALARRIMERWDGIQRAERRTSILLATGEHDIGWLEADAAPIVDATTGRIQDFRSVPLEIRQGAWPRAVARLSHDPWAAALVAHHAVFVYDRFRGEPEWSAFFAQMEVLRQTLLQRVERLTFDDLVRDYTFVRLGDLASLAFCCGWTDPQEFAGHVMRLVGMKLVVTPDPFAGREIAIEIGARALPDRSFDSAEDAANAYRAADRTVLSGSVVGAAP